MKNNIRIIAARGNSRSRLQACMLLEDLFTCICCFEKIEKHKQVCSKCERILNEFCNVPNVYPVMADELKNIMNGEW